MTIDWNKPVQTRDGRPVEIITREGRGRRPVVGYVGKDDSPTTWAADGRCSLNSNFVYCDLVNVPERVERWANVCSPDQAIIAIHHSRQEADAVPTKSRTALVKYTFEGNRLLSAEVVEVDQ